MIRRLFFPSFLILCFGSLTHAQSDSILHTLFLVGDAGELTIAHGHIGKVIHNQMSQTAPHATLIYLGDNVYPVGLPDKNQLSRERGEKILQSQVDWIKGLDVKGIFIPGNHDWQHWNRNGWKYLMNQQAWIDSLKDEHITFLPRGGCPGPVEISITDKAVLVIIDTQWLLHAHDKPGEESDCDAQTPSQWMVLLNDILERNAGKRVIMAGHHPVISYGDHGGVFTVKDHLFPFTNLYRHLYIPVPVIGSIYPVYRNVFGHPQDIKHPVYNEFSKLMQKILAEHSGTLYVAGHEHSLQYIVKDSIHYIVSGSGSKVTHVKKKKHARFVEQANGFVKLTIDVGGGSRFEFWQADQNYPEGRLLFTESISPPAAKPQPDENTIPNFEGQTVRVKASTQYGAGKGRRKMLGANYRATWQQEIEAPVFDIGKENGGLKIIQKGGGQQTLSLRLEDSTGREYVLRSIEKFPENAVPEMFRKTFAQDLVQDQISASHPYGAVVIPPLAKAVGIYHTNPRIVFIPDDPRFGKYQKMFANTLALYEERPAGDWSDAPHFGNSENIISTGKVLEKLARDNDNRVDQEFVLRSRLFDVWIGDWDRHDDQWRWATFQNKKEEVYRPIPRDRDQAFFVNEGLLPKVWSRKWALPKFEGFDESLNWPSGFSFNARYFDRTFLNGLDQEDWITIARDLQLKLTDDVIAQAIRQFPEEVYKLDGENIIRKLKARREKLLEDAVSHYRFLAREVDVVGSDKNEYFEVTRLPLGDVHVKMFKITKEGEVGKKLYDRVFKKDETQEIRLYGLKGEDKFVVDGSAERSILVKVIGGEGSDSLTDRSTVNGMRKHTIFYDLNKGNYISPSREVVNRTSSDPEVNLYDRKAFKYNRLAPLIFGNFNPDDGLFIGGGVLYQREGFRKTPFKQRHIGLASIAPLTNSYNFLYRGDFTDFIGKWTLEVNADLKSPNYVNNFFGLGNETSFARDIEYYRFRFEEIRLETYLTRRLGNSLTFKAGPVFQRVEVEDPEDKERFIKTYAETLLPLNLYEEFNTYGGMSWSLVADRRNDQVLTTRGLLFHVSARHIAGLDKHASSFSSLESSVSFYHSFSVPSRLVFAARVGGGHNFGNYEFYQAQILGGRTELRGFRKTRFYGDSKFYTNLEMRLKLASIKTYLFPASFGILGFHDLGRVWYKNEEGIDPSAGGKSNAWHKGWGGGLWFTPFNLTVLSVEAGHSEEGTLAYVRLGFLF